MKVLIIEDEALGAVRLKEMIQMIDSSIEIVGTIESIAQGIDWFRQNAAPDLIFLDIELTDGQSFELFKEAEITCPVIFTTSYNTYAQKAFELISIDYLLKPLRVDDVQKSLEKFRHMKQIFGFDIQQLELLLRPFSKQQESFRSRFLVKFGQKHLSVSIDEIAYFFGEDKIVFLVTHKKDKYIVDYTLDELENLLDPTYFYRANRSYIVHSEAVRSVINEVYGKLKLQLVPMPSKDVLVSRDKANGFKEWMGK